MAGESARDQCNKECRDNCDCSSSSTYDLADYSVSSLEDALVIARRREQAEKDKIEKLKAQRLAQMRLADLAFIKTKTLKDLDDGLRTAQEVYTKYKLLLQETCEHSFETFRSYSGTDNICRKCGKSD